MKAKDTVAAWAVSKVSCENMNTVVTPFITQCYRSIHVSPEIVGHPEPEKKILLAFLSTFWHPCSKCILMCFKKDRGGCQVWKCSQVPELGQRSTECKFLYIRQILAFLSICYPKL